MNSLLFLAVSVLASSVRGQWAVFTGVTWGDFVVGDNHTIQWTEGDGQLVSAELWSGNYSQAIFANLPAGSSFEYTIPPVAEGTYSIELLQSGIESEMSPDFSIVSAPLNSSASAMNTAAAATGTGSPGTVYIYFDEHCGCTKTALASAPTNALEGNYSTPAMTTPTSQASPVAVATYTPNAAISLQGARLPSFIVGAMLVAMFV